MNVPIKIILISLQFFLYSACFAQKENLDSLTNILPSLSDTARIGCLNALSSAYIAAGKKDSALNYAGLACGEAKKQHYIHGIAACFYNQSKIAWLFNDDFIKSEELARESLHWYGKTLDKRGIFDLYWELAILLFSQSRYDESLEFSRKAYEYAKKSGDAHGMIKSLRSTGLAYKEAGEYEKAFDFFQNAYQMHLEMKDQTMISASLFDLGELYMHTGDYHSALSYFQNAFRHDNAQAMEERIIGGFDIWAKMEYVDIFSHLGLYDSAWHYLNLYKPTSEQQHYNRIYLVSAGEYYFFQKNYSVALENFLAALPEHEKLNDRNQVMRTLIDIAKTSVELKKDSMTLKYARRGLHLAATTKAIQYKRDAYQILYLLHDKWGNKDSANFYYREYRNINDRVISEQTKVNLAAQRYNEKIAFLNKEKQLRLQELNQSAEQKKAMLFAILGILLLGIFFLRNIILKRKNEAHRREIAEKELLLEKLETKRKQDEFAQQAAGLEMQALRAQMNPHFIFNSLNSINRFILQNNKVQASEYLTKFSKLVRMILQNSQASLITLENELESLELYLELEALRFDYRFGYKISIPKDLDVDVLKVPPLIIQPFAENAIWHGLMHKEEKGQLDIEVSQASDLLFFRIADNGIGRKAAAELRSKSASKHKSVGLKITADRIAMLQSSNGNGSLVTINDLVDADGNAAGTEVILKMPVIYD